MHAKRYDRTVKPVVFRLWIKPQTNGFTKLFLLFSVLLPLDRLQLTAVYCNRRGVQRQHLKRPVCSVNLFKEFAYRSKIEFMVTVATIKIDDMKHRAKPNNV